MAIIMIENLDLSTNTVVQFQMKVPWQKWLDFARKHELIRFRQAFTRRGLSNLFYEPQIFLWMKIFLCHIVTIMLMWSIAYSAYQPSQFWSTLSS